MDNLDRVSKLDKLIRVLGIVILLCVIGLTIFWWQSNKNIIKEKVLSLREKITNKYTVLALAKTPKTPHGLSNVEGAP